MSVRSVLVIGIGNELRGDDAAGLEVARGLASRDLPRGVRVEELQGEALDLLERWSEVDAVILVDTVRSGAAPGTIHRADASSQPLPAQLRRTSSHTVSVSEAIELARSLGKLPATLIVLGIEGSRFEAGTPLQAELRDAAVTVAEAAVREAVALSREPSRATGGPSALLHDRVHDSL